MKTAFKALGVFSVHIALAVFLYSKRMSHLMDNGVFHSDSLIFLTPAIASILLYMYIFNDAVKLRSSRLGFSFILAIGAFFVSLFINLNAFGS